MSLLKTIRKGKQVKPPCILVYAEHGLGKSSFGDEAPNPVFLGNEQNDELDCGVFPIPTTWDELLKQVDSLINDKHAFETAVLDAIDSLEKLAQKKILTGTEKNKTMATACGGFGKAYDKQADMFLELREKLERLRDEKNMTLIYIAHATKAKHECPLTLSSYDTYFPSMHKKVRPIFEDWCQAILFITFETFKTEVNGRDFAVGEGHRIILTEQRPSHVAKNRFDLDYQIDFDKGNGWKVFKEGYDKFFANAKPAKSSTKPGKEKSNPELLDAMKEIDELFAHMPEENKTGIQTAIKRAGQDIDELKRILTKMRKVKGN